MTNSKRHKKVTQVKEEGSPAIKATKPGKLYVIRKYVVASSAADAIKKEKDKIVDDVWLEEGFKQESIKMGFQPR